MNYPIYTSPTGSKVVRIRHSTYVRLQQHGMMGERPNAVVSRLLTQAENILALTMHQNGV